MKKAKPKPIHLELFPVTLHTEDGQPVECLQYCAPGEEPLSGERFPVADFCGMECAMQHYASACALARRIYPSRPVPMLLLSGV